MQGQDLITLINGGGTSRKDFFYEHTFMGSPKIPKIEGVVSLEEKYMVFTEHGYEQYFDLKKDANETVNLVENISYGEKVDALRERYQLLKRQVR
jgi:hypothetical protein